uniref:Uncharacterized protein n=1 Tax=Anguilla anguilla TaxID=7936 RepID=A0A0E9WD49_ANGAN
MKPVWRMLSSVLVYLDLMKITFSTYKNDKFLTHTKHCLKVINSNWQNLGLPFLLI